MASNTPGNLPGNNTASHLGVVSQEMRGQNEAVPAAYDFWKRVQRSHALTEAEEASRQGLDESYAHEMLSSNNSSEQALHMSRSGEAVKRRRTEHEPDHHTSVQSAVHGDLVMPPSNSGVMQAANYNSYMNAPVTSGPVIPGLHSNSFYSPPKLTSYHGGSYYDTPSPFLSRYHKGQYYETPSPFLSACIRATAPGFIPQTPTRRSRASFGNLSVTESPGVSGGVSLGTNDAVTPHHYEMNGFQLPGLGAAQGSMASFSDVHHSGSNESMSTNSTDHNAFHTGAHENSGPIIPWDAGKIPGLIHQPRPLAPGDPLPSNSGAKQHVSRPITVTGDDGSKESSPHGQDLRISSDTPKTKENGSTESKSRPSEKSSDPSTICACESSSTDSAPPVWEEKHHSRAFKMQNVARNNLSEAFRGAFDILGTMNPDHYQMPRGSRVVCIKCTVIDDILMSIQTGLWACNGNVMARIVSLWEAKTKESEKVLLLWSVPGSKNFCGLAELQDYRPNATTDFFQSDAPQKGAMVVHWLYCKLVPFGDVRKMDGLQGNDTVTQMWSGMHYNEDIGRKVVQAYVQAPHFSNLLAKPPGGHFRQPPRRGNNNAGASARGGRDHRGGHRPQPHHRPNAPIVHNRAPHISDAKSVALSERSDTHQDGQEKQIVRKEMPSNNTQAVEEPKLQMMPVFVHPDGTITAAVSLQGSFSSLEQMQSIKSLKSSIPVAGSTPLTAQSTFSVAPASRLSTTEKTVSFQQLPADRGRPESKALTSHEMASPGQSYRAGGPGPVGAPRSSPSVNRFAHGYNNSDGSGSHQGKSQPQTPARRSYRNTHDLAAHTGSPLQGTPTTPRAWAGVRGQHSQAQMYQQFHTPVKTPFATRAQTPVHHEESVTPRPSDAGVLKHRPRNAEAFSSHELRTNSWIEELVGSPGKDQ